MYSCVISEFFVPAGHVGFLMNAKNEYLFAEPVRDLSNMVLIAYNFSYV